MAFHATDMPDDIDDWDADDWEAHADPDFNEPGDDSDGFDPSDDCHAGRAVPAGGGDVAGTAAAAWRRVRLLEREKADREAAILELAGTAGRLEKRVDELTRLLERALADGRELEARLAEREAQIGEQWELVRRLSERLYGLERAETDG